MNKKRKILIMTETRATYGLLYPVMRAIQKHPKLELQVMATGMHTLPGFGYTINEIKEDGFKIDSVVEMLLDSDTRAGMVKSFGIGVMYVAQELERLNPDIVVVLGDRGEPLAMTIAAYHMGIPVAHIHGGDRAHGGDIDDSMRHAITKLAHIHFPATKESAQRILKIGEERWRVHVVGAPGLDTIVNKMFLSPKDIAKKFKLDLKKPIILVIQHPYTTIKERQVEISAQQMRETMEAVKRIGEQTIVIYPNADAGGRAMISVIKEYLDNQKIRAYENLIHREYLGLMNIASVMVSNSSGGMIESSSFKLPVVNVGTRQLDRQRSTNVIDVPHDRNKIYNAIKKAIYNKKYIAKVRECRNPYGDGKTGPRIANILAKVKLDQKLIVKKITY